MFDFYHLELPKSLQSRLHNASDKHRDGSFIGAALMGVFSSLIVGPCVAAPLAAALMYIGQTGDVILGGSALFVMGFGMVRLEYQHGEIMVDSCLELPPFSQIRGDIIVGPVAPGIFRNHILPQDNPVLPRMISYIGSRPKRNDD